MYRHSLFISLALMVLGAEVTFLRAEEKPLFAPRPTKDPKASKTHAQGTGIFDIAVDKTSGKVTSVHVRSSTNNVMLDADVINTFLQWRFKPNSQSSVTIVVAFTAGNDSAYYPLVHSLQATNRGLPVDFKEPIKAEKLWQWFPERYGAAGHR
jgi:TonB family protein